jgi:hypothetical protein
LAERAAIQMGRNLTLEEWKSEFPAAPYAKTFSALPPDPSYIDDLIIRAQTSARDGRSKEAEELFTRAADEVVKTRSVDGCEVVIEKALRAGHPKSVLAAANFEVKTLSRSARALETRAKTEAVGGLVSEAIEDFRNANRQPSNSEQVARRQSWVERLERGENIGPEEFYKY